MASWKGWREVTPNGRTHSAPAAAGAVNAFVRGTDNQVFYGRLLTGAPNPSWDAWYPIAGQGTQSAPAATILNGTLYVFIRGMDNLIYFNRHVGRWEGWQPVPGGERTDAAPGVAEGVLVVRRADGAIRYNAFDGPTTWRGWKDVPHNGRTPSAPAITSIPNVFGDFVLFVRGTDDGIHYKTLDTERDTWGAWREVPNHGKTYSAPAAARGIVVVRGTDDRLHWNGYDERYNFDGWNQVPGNFMTPDAPTLAHSPGYFTLMVRGRNNGIHYTFYD